MVMSADRQTSMGAGIHSAIEFYERHPISLAIILAKLKAVPEKAESDSH
jgi:hypothetical protein